jgi:hypothetical protein
MSRRLGIGVVVGLLLAGAVVVGVVGRASVQPASPANDSTAGTAWPRLDCPARLDLGEKEIGEVAVGRFRIANAGGGQLVIDDIRTNCSCSGLEREENGRYVPIHGLRLQPGAGMDVVLRVSVRGVPVGAELSNILEFRTNDPTRPRARIAAVVRRVSGGVQLYPEALAVGTHLVGTKVQRLVEIRDHVTTPRRIKGLRSTRPEQVTARLLPPDGRAADSGLLRLGSLVALIEVTAVTTRPGEINAVIEIEVEGRDGKPDTLPVMGRVVAPIEMAPARLLLPRRSSRGPIYHAVCAFQSMTNSPLEVQAEDIPPGFVIEFLPAENPTVQTVRVTHEAARTVGRDRPGEHKLKFKARAQGEAVSLELTVLLAE